MDNKKIYIDDLYNGPMDLLLDLILSNQIDIYDIPINKITTQFINTMDQLEYYNLDVYLEFSKLASTLLKIKSQLMLPTINEDDDEIDPREDLVNRILEYNYYKNISRVLTKYYDNAPIFLEKQGEDITVLTEEAEILYSQLNVNKLCKVLSHMLTIHSYSNKDHNYNITVESISIEECIDSITRAIAERQEFSFSFLFKQNYTREYIVSYFLAMLELAKLQEIIIKQTENDIILLEGVYEKITN